MFQFAHCHQDNCHCSWGRGENLIHTRTRVRFCRDCIDKHLHTDAPAQPDVVRMLCKSQEVEEGFRRFSTWTQTASRGAENVGNKKWYMTRCRFTESKPEPNDIQKPPIFIIHQSKRDLCTFADDLQAQTMINRRVCLRSSETFSDTQHAWAGQSKVSSPFRWAPNTCFESLMNVFIRRKTVAQMRWQVPVVVEQDWAARIRTHLDRRSCRRDFCLVGSFSLSNSTAGCGTDAGTRRWPCWLPWRSPPARRDSPAPAVAAFVGAWRESPGPCKHGPVLQVRCCSARQLLRCPCNKKQRRRNEYKPQSVCAVDVRKKENLFNRKSNKDFLLSLQIETSERVHFDAQKQTKGESGQSPLFEGSLRVDYLHIFTKAGWKSPNPIAVNA